MLILEVGNGATKADTYKRIREVCEGVISQCPMALRWEDYWPIALTYQKTLERLYRDAREKDLQPPDIESYDAPAPPSLTNRVLCVGENPNIRRTVSHEAIILGDILRHWRLASVQVIYVVAKVKQVNRHLLHNPIVLRVKGE